MRTLVTGGAGFIGSHLADRLLASGHAVRVLDDLSTGRTENLAAARGRVDFLEGDVRDAAAVRRAAEGVDVILHLAALTSVPRSLEEPIAAADVNVRGTLHVLEAARALGVRRVVLASSSSVYGDVEQLPRVESMRLRPRSPYAASKAAAEDFAFAYQEVFGLEVAVLRFFNVYGPRQRADAPYAAAVPRFVEAALRGRPAVVEGDGEQSRDFTYVEDVAAAVETAAVAPGAVDGPINVGAGTRTTIRRLVEVVGEACGSHLAPTRAPARSGDVRHAQADVTRAREHLGWSASIDLREGIRRTVAAARAPVQT